MKKRWMSGAAHIVAGALLGCTPAVQDEPGGDFAGSAAPFQAVREIELEERDDVINVALSVRPDPLGGYLVADHQEAQIRRYRDDGSLAFAFGSKGGGPGEFQSAVGALRLPTGEILAVDGGGTSKIISSGGDSLLSTFPSPESQIDDIDLLPDGTVLYSGRGSGDNQQRLHVVEPPGGRVVRSFFAPAMDERFRMVATMAGLTNADVRGDTIAVVYALIDSIYLFIGDGTLLEAIGIPAKNYRPIQQPTPTAQTPQAISEWMASFSLFTGIHWLNDGGFVVQYQDRENLMPRRHMLVMTRRGEREYEQMDAPQVLTVDPTTASILFVSPDSEVPSRWTIAERER